MKKKTVLVFLCLVAVTVLGGYLLMQTKRTERKSADAGRQVSYEDFRGKRFGIMTGSVYDVVADRIFNPSEKLYFNNVVEEIQGVKLGKADAALLSDVIATLCLKSGPYDDLQTLPVPLEELNFEYGVFSTRPEDH